MDSLSIKDNILLPRILDEAEIEESKKICENLTKKFNINKLLNKKPYELSGYLTGSFAQTGNGIIEATWRNTLCFTPCSIC